MNVRHRWFPLIMMVGTLAVVGVLSSLARWYLVSNTAGRATNRAAWIASFEERGLPAPEEGPRDGYWQSKVPSRDADPGIGWIEMEYVDPGRIEIDANGWQHYRSRGEARHQILILGGSVAFGAYASNEQTVYFTRLGRRLDEDPRTASDIVVVSSIAWKSSQELVALAFRTEQLKPDWVIAIDGLNDVTNGSTAASLYGAKTETLDGSEWSTMYHAHDYRERVIEYIDNVVKITSLAEDRGAATMVVLQPALFERAPATAAEIDLLSRSRAWLGPPEQLVETYAAMRRGLLLVQSRSWLEFVDASRLFEGEQATTFTDMWHFSDPGHAMLADAIADRLVPLMLEQVDEDD